MNNDTNIDKIMKLCDYIDDELKVCEEYIDLAIKMKDDDKPTADMFYGIAVDEMDHVRILNTIGKKVMADAKTESPETYPVIEKVHEWSHKKQTEKADELNGKLEKYR